MSADSVQIYRRFDVGSGKPSAGERSRVQHHLLDVLEPTCSAICWDDGAAAGAARGAQRQRAAMKGSDVASEVIVDFVWALRGAELKLQLQDGGEEVTVRIPAGDGDRVRVPGHGAPGLFGAKVRVPTPHGDVMLTVPKHAQSGQVVRLEGKGVKRKNTQGDLYVRFLVKLPDVDTPETQKALEVPCI